ncbi:MAG: DUF3488 domain-containing protein [Nitrospirae bacterium]|nr:DUF3488 domain-containing protein [Nitrospirota bacterium]
MNLERAFRLSSILLAASGFSGLLLTGAMPIGLVVLGLSGLLVSLAHVFGWGADWFIFKLSRGTWNVLMIVAFLAFGVDLLWISQDLLPAGVHFLIILMVNKLLNLQQRKDFLQLYAISLSGLLATAALTVELWYGAVFIAYLLAAIWTLLLYHLKSEAEEVQLAWHPSKGPVGAARTPGPITARMFWTTNGIAVGAFCLTLTIFFVTPRIGTGYFQKNRVERLRTSGFSEKVDLGVIGAIKLDPTVVMRVEFPDQKGPVAERIYFRGAAFDTYNGRSWANSLAKRHVLGRSRDGDFKVSDAAPAGKDPAGFRQEILIEALDVSVLFGVSFVDSVKGNFLILQADGMGSVYFPYPPTARFQYSVYSTPDHLLKEERTAASMTYPAHIKEHFLQLPDLSPRVAELARTVAQQAKTPYEMALAVERHLQENYRYSLEVGMELPVSPVEEFLFTRKTGYCEHYATAMVMMLRSLGIPARLTTGFLPGEWNDFGNYYTVRQRDAHAWVEVYFPRSGWVTFDPTPSVAVGASNPLWTKVARVVDSIRLKWDRFVIQYSFRDQMAVAQGVRERSDQVRVRVWGMVAATLRWWATVRTWFDEFSRTYGVLLAGGLVICAGIAGLIVAVAIRGRRWAGRLQAGLPTARQVSAVRLYARMLRLLESRGFGKPPGATPLEFARHVSREWAGVSSFVLPLTELYYRVRFGRELLTPQDRRRAEELLGNLLLAKR